MAETKSPAKWTQKVLIVEDNEPTRKLMVKYFEKARQNRHLNCQILEAANGKEATQVMEKTHPDIILSDIHMPVMDGFELLSIFRKQYLKQHPFAFFCFLSSSVDEKGDAFRKGAMGFIAKDEMNYFAFTLQLKAWLRMVFLERTLEIKRTLQIF